MEQEIDRFRASTTRWLFGSFAGWGTLALCCVGVGLVIAAVRWIGNVRVRYTLTNQRLIVRQGLVIRREDEIELHRVKDVSVAYSLPNTLTDIGTLALTSSDRTTGSEPFELRDIPNARAIRERLRTLVDEARQRRRVREMDVDWDGRA